ncbi:unnamed protein product [Brassica rapa subsp. trilocularis]
MSVALFDDVERLGGSCRSGGLWRRMVSRRGWVDWIRSGGLASSSGYVKVLSVGVLAHLLGVEFDESLTFSGQIWVWNSPVRDRRGESFRVTAVAAACFACNNRLSSCVVAALDVVCVDVRHGVFIPSGSTGNGSDLPPCCYVVEALWSCFWFSVVAQGGLFGSPLGHWSEVFPWETCVRIGLPSTSVIRLDHFGGLIFGLLCRKDERHQDVALTTPVFLL